MNDFNAILGKVKNWANAAGKKAEEVAETSKLKMQILSVNGEISKAYEALGKLVYEAAKNNDSVGEEMEAAMDKIDELKDKLAELEGNVSVLKKEKNCGNCGASCALDAQFCSRCGAILEAVAPMAEEDVEIVDEDSFDELCADEDCCGNCRCEGDCSTCDEKNNKCCDGNCAECDCCEEDNCECTCPEVCHGSCGCSCHEEVKEESCGCGCGCHCHEEVKEEACSCGCGHADCSGDCSDCSADCEKNEHKCGGCGCGCNCHE